MRLGDLIKELESHDPERLVANGFAHPNSYRGYYERVAFAPARNVTVRSMLASARGALGATFAGWKGGEYTMNADSLVHIARDGECNDPDDALNIYWLRAMLEGAAEKAAEKAEWHGLFETACAKADKLAAALRFIAGNEGAPEHEGPADDGGDCGCHALAGETLREVFPVPKPASTERCEVCGAEVRAGLRYCSGLSPCYMRAEWGKK